jgi:basic membrane lipoprotein Med (substrate-binding protein (PBP1-ABC) superfamily)
MKKILLILALTGTLSGCMNLNFDNLEYDRFITVKQLAQRGELFCGKDEASSFAKQLKEMMVHQSIYAENRGGRPNIKSATAELDKLVDELNVRFDKPTPPSEAYCKQKFADIRDGATDIVFAIGKLQ